MLPLIAFATFLSTLLGGVFAIRFRDKLHLILGFSAGTVVAVAFFDLIPEALALGSTFRSPETTALYVACGFFTYLLLDRLLFYRAHAHEHAADDIHPPASRGTLGASALVVHSFLDGIAIGLAFQVSAATGAIVTAAVLTHDFSDGINTVNFILKHAAQKARAVRWLIADALAPVAGVISTLFFVLPASGLGIVLSLFAGFFLYMGASELIPESHHAHPRFLTTFMTLLGAGVLYAAIQLAPV